MFAVAAGDREPRNKNRAPAGESVTGFPVCSKSITPGKDSAGANKNQIMPTPTLHPLDTMKTPKIAVLIDRADYEVCAAAARLASRASGKPSPDTEAMIAFQFKFRTPEGLARDYLDCQDDREARLKVRVLPARSRPPATQPRQTCPGKPMATKKTGTERGPNILRAIRKPADFSRN